MHRAELARLEQDAHYDRERLTPVVAPGSTEEARALALIDQARDDGEDVMRDHPDFEGQVSYRRGTSERGREQRQAAATRYWRRHARDA